MCGAGPKDLDKSKSPWRIGGSLLDAKKEIEIEKYKGPVFITHGMKDKVWSVQKSKNIEAKLKNSDVEIHYFPGEGHGFSGKAQNKRNGLLLNFLKRKLK